MERSSQGEASAAVRWDGPTVRDFTGELPVLVNVAHPMARKWVITPIINGISRVNPLITGVPTIHSTWINGDLFIQYLQLSIVGSTVIHDRPI